MIQVLLPSFANEHETAWRKKTGVTVDEVRLDHEFGVYEAAYLHKHSINVNELRVNSLRINALV